MDVRSLGFRTDLALLTMSGSEVHDCGTHLVVRTPANPTYYWGNFLLLPHLPAPGGVGEVLDVFDDEFPDARHYAIGVDGTDDQREQATALFEGTGLTATSASVMTAAAVVPPARPHESAEVRPLAGDDDWEQRVQLTVAVGPGEPRPGLESFARGKAEQERALVAAGHGERYGAFVDGRLLSHAGIFRTEPGVARFQSVETHPDARRQGLAGTVVHAAARHALERLGATTLVIVADPDDEAIRIYRALGFVEAERQLELELAAT